MAMVCCRLTAGQNLIKGSGLYAYPAGTSFCSCASSRAALHVGSLFLRNRQPSNAPPLLLSPTGRATRWGPLMQNTLGDTPRPHAPERPLGKPKGGFPKRGLNGAYRGLWAHLPPSPPLPRSGGGGFLSHFLLVLLQRSASADCYEHKGAANSQVLAHLWLSSPPQRRGEGWWFALRAPAQPSDAGF